MYDILIFVYETFFSSGVYPTNAVLQNRLFAAGFEPDEVEQALAWLDSVDQLPEATPSGGSSDAFRCLTSQEFDQLGQEGWGFLAFLESSGILSAEQREWIIASAMALDNGPLSLDKLKLITLTVFWRQGQPMDILLIEELIGEAEPSVH
jgi:Smg protein